MDSQAVGDKSTPTTNVKAIVLNPMAEGVTELNLRGWLRKVLDAHQRQAPEARGVYGFLFLSEVFVGRLTSKALLKMIDSSTRKYSMLEHIAVVYVDEVMTDSECESVIGDFYRPGADVPDL